MSRARVRMTSASSIVVPTGAPGRGADLAHVERARHRVALDRAGEPEAQRVAVPLRIRTRDLHRVAVDRAGEVAGDEIALVRALETVAGLPEVQRVRRFARQVDDAHV